MDDKKTISVSGKSGDYSISFSHKKLDTIPSNLKDEFQEAIVRFGSLLAENIENMDKYELTGNTQMSGIINTTEKLREANEVEDQMSDVSAT